MTDDTRRILALHTSGLTPKRIAALCDQRLTPEQAAHVLEANGLKPRLRRQHPERSFKQVPPTRKPPPLKVNPVRSALVVLGRRATEGDRGFAVDGRPVGVFDLIRKANAVLKEAGMPQLDACEEWVVRD